ncbi:peptidase, M23/M37 family [Candidatus Pelagibacter sp. IMCC9063]|uniref:M23 family metallopeptidase n=1 Tax=Pelagibacter sp. (strain IMCC9063) TaxID=1002672 RepID=UPI0002046541|nr:M23 family metallopeptidase [Candidatus Pelagibacter sp. IMCC9063]AEA80614.1 peptidase, M23/M37 family [Candidatus Pelagibacter sp. IMCC9063]
MKKNHQKIPRNYLIIFLILIFFALLFFVFSSKDFVSKGYLNEREESTKESKKEFKDAYSFFFNTDFIPNKKIIKVVAGDSLQKILLKEKISKVEVNKIYQKTKGIVDLTKIKQGQTITIIFRIKQNKPSISRITFQVDELSTAYIYYSNKTDDYEVRLNQKNLEKINFLAKGVIVNSLFASAQKIDVDAEVVVEFARIFGFEIDFQRDIRKNDEFRIFYERFEDDEGENFKNGNILFAYLKNSGREIKLYRYKDSKNNIGYFTPDGKSIEKALMKTPINGARLSSGYGMRKHPILGYNKLHQGTDFAARRGTPVMASGSGTVERASWFGAYGKYVRIRHNSTYKTAYAHLSKFGRNIKAGRKVKQGQIIGYVGSTGRSTGPHLHYEVLVNNKRINSQRLKLPSGKKLSQNEMENFNLEKQRIDQLAEISKTTK